MSTKLRGVRQQERVGEYYVSLKQNLHNPATEPRGLEYEATFLFLNSKIGNAVARLPNFNFGAEKKLSYQFLL